MKFVIGGMSFCCMIYVAVGIIGIYTFGYKLQGDIVETYNEMKTWETIVLRFVLLVLFLTHTPFIFFIGKEAMLTLIA